MNLSLPIDDLMRYVFTQMNNLFPDGSIYAISDFKKEFNIAIERLENCFKHIKKDNYCYGAETFFNHLHSDQYTMFLWFLSNTIWNEIKDTSLCNKLFYANKALNGFSCMYDTQLPDIFLLLHTVGTVLGKAQYSNYFIAAQGCTVGAHHGLYPKIGENVSMLTNSSIVGNCLIGNNVSLGINASIYNADINDNSVIFVNSQGELDSKYKQEPWSKQWFF